MIYGIMTKNIKLLGTRLELGMHRIVVMNRATNIPGGDRKYFVKPVTGQWTGNYCDAASSMLVDESDVEVLLHQMVPITCLIASLIRRLPHESYWCVIYKEYPGYWVYSTWEDWFATRIEPHPIRRDRS